MVLAYLLAIPVVYYVGYKGYEYLTSSKRGGKLKPNGAGGALQSSYGPQPHVTSQVDASIHTVTPGSEVTVRSKPSTLATPAGKLPDKANVRADVPPVDGNGKPTTPGKDKSKFWFKVNDTLTSITGYVRGDFVVLNEATGAPVPSKTSGKGPAAAPPPNVFRDAATARTAAGLSKTLHGFIRSPHGGTVNVRKSPMGTVIKPVPDGTEVVTTAATVDDSGKKTACTGDQTKCWYFVSVLNSSLQGYVRGDFVKL